MSIRRRETKAGVRYDVQWRLPDRSKRKKTFVTERAAKQFEAKLVTSNASGECLDPRGGRTELETVYRSWIASRPDLSTELPPRISRQLEIAYPAALRHLADREDRPRVHPAVGQ